MANNSKHLDKPIDKYIHGKRVLNQFNLFHLNEYSKTDIIKVLDTYFKFMVVRHPMDRLVSSFHDKLNPGNKPYKESMGADILKEFRPWVKTEEAETGENVTFNEFIQYIVKYQR